MAFLRRLIGNETPARSVYLYSVGPDGVQSVKANSPLYNRFFDLVDDDADSLDLPRSIAGLVKAYRLSVWVYRCVRVRAHALAAIPLVIKDTNAEMMPEHPLSTVFSGHNSKLLYKTESDLQVFGRAFWSFGLEKATGRAKVRRLNPMTIEVDADHTGIRGYVQRINGQVIAQWQPHEMVMFSDYAPDNDLGGQSPVSVALRAAGVTINISAFSEYFFRNGAIPDVILVSQNRLSDPDKERVQTEWRRRFGGVEKSHGTAILEGSLFDLKTVTPPLKDLAMAELREEERRDICAALGVPMSIAQAADPALYAAKQDYANFHTLTVLPELDMLVDTINEHLMPRYGLRGAYVEADTSKVQALQEDLLEITQRNQAGVAAGYLSLNEARKREGLDPLTINEHEVDYFIIAGTPVAREKLLAGNVSDVRPMFGPLGMPSSLLRLPDQQQPTSINGPATIPDSPQGTPANLASTQGLNGAQIEAALRILTEMRQEIIAAAAAYELLIALGIDEARAHRMVQSMSRLPELPASIPQRERDDIRPARGVIDLIVRSVGPDRSVALTGSALRDQALGDLQRWQRKAAKKGADAPFESDYIPPAMMAFLHMDLQAWDGETVPDEWVKRAFDRAEMALKADDDSITEFETFWRGIDSIYEQIARFFDGYAALLPGVVARALGQAGQGGTEQALQVALQTAGDEFAAQLVGNDAEFGPLLAAFLAGAVRGDELLAQARPAKASLTIDWSLVHKAALEWARRYVADLVRGINETTLDVFRTAIADWIDKGGSLENLAKFIEDELPEMDIPQGWSPAKVRWAVSRERARLIAQTESTRAFAEGSITRWEQAGVTKGRWRTNNDELVCPLCGRLNNVIGNLREGWRDPKTGELYRPPAHPGCRCPLAPVVELD
ncbi:MAG: hypothetical protein BroJett042_31400 [Bacteroidota bacterium]|nr:MAG: hypothetical protein BroJett042_31400 [Bacteroidota bacterium]